MLDYDKQLLELLKNPSEKILTILEQWRIETVRLEDDVYDKGRIIDKLQHKIRALNKNFSEALEDMDDEYGRVAKENVALRRK
jgi:hypothetical protein